MAAALDEEFPATFRAEFAIPTFASTRIDAARGDEPVTYLCGNSLGLMPRAAREAVAAELDVWAGAGVLGHHARYDGRDPWITNDERVAARLAALVFGCQATEIAYTGTLTANLNALLQAFYRPTPQRYKLLCEAKAFPSDMYSFQNQVRLAGFDPADALVLATPRPGEDVLRTEDVEALVAAHADSLAVAVLPGVQYYTGQRLDIARLTRAVKAAGAVAGWDLAHAAGNVPLALHDWGVDFAVFCSYKYLNCGAGNLGGLFVHEETARRHADAPRAAGWWGVDVRTRFEMAPEFVPAAGARGYAQSNVSLFGPPCMHAALDVFERAGGVAGLAPRRESLVAFLDAGLRASRHYGRAFRVMTDALPADARGCQLSLVFTGANAAELMPRVVADLTREGVIGDERRPNVLRWAPNPLYNTHAEVAHAVRALNAALDRHTAE